MIGFMKLTSVALATVAVTVLLYIADKRLPGFKDMKYMKKQIIIGIIFGMMATLGNHFGIDVNGALTNVRDSAPLCAGFVFGAPAGLIAGFIGGTERYLSTIIWGMGEYTQVACTIATLFAGVMAAVTRKYVFDDKRPAWIYALALAGVVEVIHMLLVFLIHMNDFIPAYNVVSQCSVIMIPMNAMTVGAAVLVVNRLNKEEIGMESGSRGIAQNMVMALFITVVLAFGVTYAFVASIQAHIAINTAESRLSQTLNEIDQDIEDSMNSGYYVYEVIQAATKNRHIGKNGGVLVLDNEYNIIGHSTATKLNRAAAQQAIFDNWKYLEDLDNGVMFETEADNQQLFCMKKEEGRYTVLGYYPQHEALVVQDASTTITLYVVILILGILFIQIFLIVKNTVVKNIKKINERLARIAAGNLDTTVDVKGSEEFINLSNDINKTVSTLKHYIKAAEERIEEELKFAKDIQESSLNREYPENTRFELYANMEAAKEVGGDFYDFFGLGDDKYLFMVADVSGKGIPGAMFMMKTKTLLNGMADTGASVGTVLTRMNEELCKNNEAGMFVTAWVGILDINTNLVTYANAGHNPPILLKNDGRAEYIKGESNFVLAGMEGIRYKTQEIQLEKGDSIFLYTDGVTEATDIDNELYGEERLLKEISELTHMRPREVCRFIKNSVDEFVGKAPQFDDITMLDLRIKLDNEATSEYATIPTLESVEAVQQYMETRAEILELPMKVSARIGVIVDEIYSNIVHYSGATMAKIDCKMEEDLLELKFVDNGIEYNPFENEDPDVELSADEREIGGLGVYMVKNMSERVEYERINRKNVVKIYLAVE